MNLHLVCGLPGAGKTTRARRLEAELPAVRLCPDEWIARLIDDPPERSAMDAMRGPVEAMQWALACRLLTLGLDVICENGFWRRDERIDLREQAKALGARVVLHWLDVPTDVLIERVDRRNRALPPGTFAIPVDEIGAWAAAFEAPDVVEQAGYDRVEIVRA